MEELSTLLCVCIFNLERNYFSTRAADASPLVFTITHSLARGERDRSDNRLPYTVHTKRRPRRDEDNGPETRNSPDGIHTVQCRANQIYENCLAQ